MSKSYKEVDIEPFYIGAANATFSEDASLMASAVMEDVVVIDRSTNKVLHSIQGDSTEVTALQMSPDGRFLAIIGQSQQLRIVSLETGSIVKSQRLSSACYISAADSSSSLFAFGLTDGSVIVWDVGGNFITHNLKGHGATVSSLTFYGEAGGQNWKLASGDIMGTVKIWDLVKRASIFTATEHTSAVRGLQFSPDGSRFVSAARDKLAIVYQTKGWKELTNVPVDMSVEAAGFVTIDGSEYMYTAGGGCQLKVWDLEEEKLVAETRQPLETTEELMIMQVVKIEGALVAVLSDQTIVDIAIPEDLSSPILAVTRRMAGNHGTIADMRYVGPELDLMALATNSPALRVVDFVSRPFDMQLYEGHTDLLNAIDATVDGLWVVTASKDHTARLWQYEDGLFVCYCIFEGHSGSVSAVGLPRTPVTGYPRFVITASEDNTIKKWSVPARKDQKLPIRVTTSDYTRRAHDKVVHSLDVSPSNDYIATASHDKTTKIWDLQSGETVGVLRGHKRAVYDVSFSAYDKVVATCAGDQTARVWSLDDFTCKRTYEGHANAVQRVAFIDRGVNLVGAGADGLIKVWQVASGECIKTLDNHDNRIWALCVKQDGSEFVSADADGAVTVWQDNTEEAKQEQDARDKVKVEEEQKLQNCLNEGDWVAAFQLAMKLDHPMRLYNVVRKCTDSHEDSGSVIGSFQLEKCIAELDDDHAKTLLGRIRDWNTNPRMFSVAQKLIRVLLDTFGAQRLSQIPGVIPYIEAILPYSQRHYARYDDLVEQSYMLDYVGKKMSEVL